MPLTAIEPTTPGATFPSELDRLAQTAGRAAAGDYLAATPTMRAASAGPEPTLGQTWRARAGMTLAQSVLDVALKPKSEPDVLFNPYQYIQSREDLRTDPTVQALVERGQFDDSDSLDHFNYDLLTGRQYLDDAQTVSRAGTAKGALTAVGAMIGDPANLIPLGPALKAAHAGTTLARVVKSAAILGGANLAIEKAQNALQPASNEPGLSNEALAAVSGAAFGAGLGFIASPAFRGTIGGWQQSRKMAQLRGDLERVLAEPVVPPIDPATVRTSADLANVTLGQEITNGRQFLERVLAEEPTPNRVVAVLHRDDANSALLDQLRAKYADAGVPLHVADHPSQQLYDLTSEVRAILDHPNINAPASASDFAGYSLADAAASALTTRYANLAASVTPGGRLAESLLGRLQDVYRTLSGSATTITRGGAIDPLNFDAPVAAENIKSVLEAGKEEAVLGMRKLYVGARKSGTPMVYDGRAIGQRFDYSGFNAAVSDLLRRENAAAAGWSVTMPENVPPAVTEGAALVRRYFARMGDEAKRVGLLPDGADPAKYLPRVYDVPQLLARPDEFKARLTRSFEAASLLKDGKPITPDDRLVVPEIEADLDREVIRKIKREKRGVAEAEEAGFKAATRADIDLRTKDKIGDWQNLGAKGRNAREPAEQGLYRVFSGDAGVRDPVSRLRSLYSFLNKSGKWKGAELVELDGRQLSVGDSWEIGPGFDGEVAGIDPDTGAITLRITEHPPEIPGASLAPDTFDFVVPESEPVVAMRETLTRANAPDLGDLGSFGAEPAPTVNLNPPEVVKARSEQAAQPETIGISTPERMALREKIANELYGEGAATKERKAYVVIGPPASGKSSVAVNALVKREGALVIDADMAKELLPEFGGGRFAGAVHRESSVIADAVRQKAMSAGDNVVLPIVGKNADKVVELAADLRRAGYEPHLIFVDLAAEKAAARSVSRFKESGRFVDPQYVLSVGSKPLEAYNAAKKAGGYESVLHVSNDVPRGESPRLVDQAGNPTDTLRVLGNGLRDDSRGRAPAGDSPDGGPVPETAGTKPARKPVKLTEGDLPPDLRDAYRKLLPGWWQRNADAAWRKITEPQERHGVVAPGAADSAAARTLTVNEADLAGFLVTDLERVLGRYHNSIGGRVAVRRAIQLNHSMWADARLHDGSPIVDGPGLMAYLRETAGALDQFASLADSKLGREYAGKDSLVPFVRKLKNRIERDVRMPLDLIEGRNPLASNGGVYAAASYMGRSMVRLSYGNKLGSVAIAQLNDLAPVAVYNMTRPSAWAFIPRAILQLKSLPKRDLEILGLMFDGQARTRAIADADHLSVDYGVGEGAVRNATAKLERGLERGGDALSRASGLQWITETSKRAAGGMAIDRLLLYSKRLIKARDLVAGGMEQSAAFKKAGLGWDGYLAGWVNRMGLDADAAERFHRLVFDHGLVKDGRPVRESFGSFERYMESKAFVKPNFAEWPLGEDGVRDLLDRVLAGLNGEVSRGLVVSPGAFDRPIINHTVLGRMFNQFQGFSMAFSNQRLRLMAQMPLRYQMSYVATYLMLGALSDAIGSALSGRRSLDDSIAMWRDNPLGGVYAAWGRAGLSSWFDRPIAIADAAGLPWSPGNALGAAASSTAARHIERGQFLTFAGPAFADLDSALRLASRAGSGQFDRTTARMGAKLLPFQNLLWLRLLQKTTGAPVTPEAIALPKAGVR